MHCDNTLCKGHVFTERLSSIAAPWARRTIRLADRLTAVGLALDGSACVRLGRKFGLLAYRNTLPLPSKKAVAAALIQNLRMPAALAVVEVHRLLGDVAGTTLPGSILVVEKSTLYRDPL